MRCRPARILLRVAFWSGIAFRLIAAQFGCLWFEERWALIPRNVLGHSVSLPRAVGLGAIHREGQSVHAVQTSA